MARRASLRASDADREAVAERLRRATAEGRLLAEELEERLARAFRARTYGELDVLVADIPHAIERRRSSGLHPWVLPAIGLAIVLPVALALIAAVVFVVTSVFAVWLLWLAVGWWLVGRRGWCSGTRRSYRSRGRVYSWRI